MSIYINKTNNNNNNFPVYMYIFGNCSFKVPEMRQPGISLGNIVGCV